MLPRTSRDVVEESSLDGFANVQFVEVDTIHPVPSSRAAGIRAASAPIVFLGETHSFPDPHLAEMLIAAHENDWDAVVPGLSNANPKSAWSWASFLMDYGTWDDSLEARPIEGGPTWNVAYRKSFLMEIDSRLDQAMEHGDELAVWFHERNGRAYFEPRARLEHANCERFQSWAEQRYLCGVLVASSRRKRWKLGRRALYIAASPLIPFVIMRRLWPTVRALRAKGALPLSAIPAMLLGTILRTAGEVVGYSRGATPAQQPRIDHFEIHKLAFTSMQL